MQHFVFCDHPSQKDYADIAKKENLKPIELELRKMQDQVLNLQSDFSYLKKRELKHRDTNGEIL